MTQPPQDTGRPLVQAEFRAGHGPDAGAGPPVATLTAPLSARSAAGAAGAEPAAADLAGIDLAALNRLMACAGAAHAAELRRRLLADLAAVMDGLRAARAAAEVARHAHVLVALSGQAGAAHLHALASDMVADAGRGDSAAVRDRLPDVLDATAALSRVVAALRPGGHADPRP